MFNIDFYVFILYLKRKFFIYIPSVIMADRKNGFNLKKAIQDLDNLSLERTMQWLKNIFFDAFLTRLSEKISLSKDSPLIEPLKEIRFTAAEIGANWDLFIKPKKCICTNICRQNCKQLMDIHLIFL